MQWFRVDRQHLPHEVIWRLRYQGSSTAFSHGLAHPVSLIYLGSSQWIGEREHGENTPILLRSSPERSYVASIHNDLART